MNDPGTSPTPLPKLPDLTRSEIDVMKVLWTEGRQSAREVHDRMPASLAWAYSTTRTTLDRIVRKGLAERSTFHGLFLYEALVSRPQGLAAVVRRFAERVLEVPPSAVVSLFSESGTLSAAEVEELQRLIDSESE